MGWFSKILDNWFGIEAPKPPDPPPLPKAPGYDDPAVRAAAEQRRRDEAKKFGRKKTILTSPLGDTSEAPVKKTVLGQ